MEAEEGWCGLFRWITNSAEADLFIVFANVDPSKGYKGITAFMVEKESVSPASSHLISYRFSTSTQTEHQTRC